MYHPEEENAAMHNYKRSERALWPTGPSTEIRMYVTSPARSSSQKVCWFATKLLNYHKSWCFILYSLYASRDRFD